MKIRLLALLTIVVLFPGVALAHPPAPSGTHCGASHADLLDTTHCVTGVIAAAGDSYLAVRPPHGKPKHVVLTNDTIYQTDSGAAALEGLVEGDFVCVTGHPKDDSLVADVVVFDVRPFSCDQ